MHFQFFESSIPNVNDTKFSISHLHIFHFPHALGQMAWDNLIFVFRIYCRTLFNEWITKNIPTHWIQVLLVQVDLEEWEKRKLSYGLPMHLIMRLIYAMLCYTMLQWRVKWLRNIIFLYFVSTYSLKTPLTVGALLQTKIDFVVINNWFGWKGKHFIYTGHQSSN